VTQPNNGTVAITDGGTGLTYQPNPDYCNNNGGTSDEFTYTLSGGGIGTVSITVSCVDDAPVAIHDSKSVTEDDPATAVDVLANDTDVDGGPKTVASVTQPAHGTVVRNPDGSALTYEPNANYCNFPGGAPSDDFTYTLNGGSSGTVSMTVDCVDDAPVAVNDSATVTEDDGATVIPAMSNDTDVDGGLLGILSVTQPANGTVDTSGNGAVLTYKPNADYCNTLGTNRDTFTYTLNGGNSATVTMTVTCVDDVPVAVNDSATVTEDANATSISVLGNDTDIDGGPKTINSVGTTGTHGTVAITGGGSGLTYKPDANYCNTPSDPADTFTYTLNGGSAATVSMTVNCVDDLPNAVNDSDTVTGNSGPNTIGVLANDTDVDGGPKSISSFTQPGHGVVAGAGGSTGAWTSLTYDPDQSYCGTDSFSYTVNGGSSATVSITVDCSGAPTAVDDTKTVTEDAAATAIDVLANDTDPDGGANTADLQAGRELLQYAAGRDSRHLQLHPERRVHGAGVGDRHLRQRRPDRGGRQRDGHRGRPGDCDSRPIERQRHRGRRDHGQLGHPGGPRDRRNHRRRHGPDLQARCQLLQHAERSEGHLHLHGQRQLGEQDGHRLDDGHLRR
jgi:VCBS repeat-containing protein